MTQMDGWVDLEAMTTQLDGVVYPILRLLDVNGAITTDPDKAVTYHAGEGRTWFHARIHRNHD